jgi:hypothetical protein
MKITRLAILLVLVTAAATGCRRSPVADPQTAAGCLEQVSATEIVGWAWNKSNSAAPVRVEILDDDILMATVKADLFREDLKQAGLGDGRHQFRLAIPDSLKDGKPHLMRARIAGTTNELRNSPKTFPSTQAIQPNQPAVFEGFLEHVSATEVIGWAVDRSRPGEPVEVEILDGDKPLATVKADLYREDLKRAGLSDGRHQFRFAVPASLRDGQSHPIHVRFAGTKAELNKSPKNLEAPPPPRKP